jgi:prophage DNA circulation protein
MTWLDDLLPGSIDGVPFRYRTVGTDFGRRGVIHEYAGRDAPFVRDMGRKAESFSIEAFFLGDNYHVERQRLETVLKSGRDLQFVHPYDGPMTVKLLGRAHRGESDQERAWCTITFTLHESGVATPKVFVPTPSQIAALADLAIETFNTKTKFSLLGAIAHVMKAVANAINTAASAINKVNGKIGAALSLIDNIKHAVDDLRASIGTLLNTPTALMSKLTGLVMSVLGLVRTFVPVPPVDPEALPEVPDLVEVTMRSAEELMGFDVEPSVVATPGTEQPVIEETALRELKLAVQAATVVGASSTVAALELSSATQAADVQQRLARAYDTVLRTPDLDADVHQALTAVKASTFAYLVEQQKRLPVVTTVRHPYSMPALVLAYELYGDASRADEIIARNRLPHPLFVPGNTEIEVLAS